MKRSLSLLLLIITFSLVSFLGKGTQVIAAENDDLSIVQDGEAHSIIVIGEEANEDIQESADILVEYVQKSTGVELQIMSEVELEEGTPEQIRIYIGDNFNEDAQMEDGLEDLDGDGFLIYPGDSQLTIVGPTDLGTRNGVYEFLERYVGVRWLMPGKKWEDVPQNSTILVPRENIREEPDFQFRSMNLGADGDEHKQIRNEWKLQNKIQSPQQLQLGHNLYSLFPVEKYGETHPEFYPNGEPPPPGVTAGWQPCFTEEGTIDTAVSGIIAYFDNNPDETSYSLAVNDSDGYCEGDPSHPNYPDKINSVGRQDMSEIYYAWVNEVVEQVLEVYPDKWFGLYAYHGAMDPPSFDVHPRAIPVITKDRLAWLDDDIQEGGHQHLEAWEEVTNQTGWYAYLYGYLYFVPRVYSQLIAENYKYAKEKNVLTHHADFHPSLGDGPKPWLSAKLQWDTDQDVDELLGEWYERAVGPEAAPELAAYYDLWEEFWMERSKDSSWFQESKNDTYLSLKDYSYLELVTEEDIHESRRLLEMVVDKADTEERQIRAELMLRQFEFYEASALSYPKKVDPPSNEKEAIKMLENAGKKVRLGQKRYELVEEFKDELSLRFPGDPFERGATWTGWNSYEFWHLKKYIREQEPENGAVTERVKEIAHQFEPTKLREYARLLLHAKEENSIMRNPSFEEGNTNAPPWRNWIAESGSMKRVEGIAYTGNASYQVNLVDRGGPYQFIDVEPGLLVAQAHYYTPHGTDTNGKAEIFINARNAGGKNLYSTKSKVFNLSETVGKWSSIEILEEIPETYNDEEVKEIQIGMTINGVGSDTPIYVDDFVVYQDEYQYVPTITDILSHVKEFEKQGEFNNTSAARALRIHLSAIDHFEKQGKAKKVIKHISGFHQLLDHQLESELISEEAYQMLQSDAVSLMKQHIELNTQKVNATPFGKYPVSITFNNHDTQPMDVTFEGEFPDGISLELDRHIIDAGQSVDIEGHVQILKDLPVGDYEGTIAVKIDGDIVQKLHITMNIKANLLQNAGFEKLNDDGIPISWIPHKKWSTDVVESSSEEAYTGDRSVKITAKTDHDENRLKQLVDVEGGKTYQLSAWIKSNLLEGGRVQMKMELYHDVTGADGWVGEVNSEGFDSHGEWENITMEVDVPSEANIASILLRVYGPGETYYDDASFRMIE